MNEFLKNKNFLPSPAQVKLWRLCDPEQEQPSSPELTLRPDQGKLELVQFHPTSSALLAVGAAKTPLVWDTSRPDAPLAGDYITCTLNNCKQNSNGSSILTNSSEGLCCTSCVSLYISVFCQRVFSFTSCHVLYVCSINMYSE